jgi:hypothetical protein
MAEVAKVDKTSRAYDAMAREWRLLDDLVGGTQVMREAAETWLPRSEGESRTKWDSRVSMSFLFSGYADTLTKVSTKPFATPIVVRGELPPQLAPIEDDADRSGRNLTQFGKDVMREATHRGLTHVFVDFPEGQSSNNQEEVTGKRRPYFVHVPARDLIAWRAERDKLTGEKQLTHIRWKSVDVEPEGEYGEKEVETIRVWNAPPRDELGKVAGLGTWEKWVKVESESPGAEKEWTLKDSGVHMFPGVPLATFYANRTGHMTADPPLKALAWQNLRHFQSSSEQNNILHVARVPILFRKGWSKDPDTGKPIQVGITESATTTSEVADMKWVEPAGHAIKSGEEDLGKTEERMEILGAQPFMRRTGGMVATGRAIDNAESNSMVSALVVALELFLADVFKVAGQWLNLVVPSNVKIPDDFAIDIPFEPAMSARAEKDIEALIKARIAREISRETFLRELKARSLLSETVDIDEEIERIEDEGPDLSVMGLGDDDAAADDDGPDIDDKQDEEDAADAEAAA